MPKPYDAVTKRLLETNPQDWGDFLKLPQGKTQIRDTDLSTVSSVADKIISEESELWAATNVLMGLRCNAVFKAQVLRRVRRMRESITYQEILAEGRVEGQLEEARRMVIRAGLRRLGPVTPEAEARIQEITSLSVLESRIDRVFDVETWDDLLVDVPAQVN